MFTTSSTTHGTILVFKFDPYCLVSLELSEIDWLGPGYLVQNRVSL